MCKYFQQNNESDSRNENAHTAQLVEALTAKLNQAQEDSKEEKAILALLTDKNKEYELELERLPLLIAQVSYTISYTSS